MPTFEEIIARMIKDVYPDIDNETDRETFRKMVGKCIIDRLFQDVKAPN